MKRSFRTSAALAALLSLASCATVVRPEAPAPADAIGPHAEPWAAWSRVLAEHVDEQGRVDYAGLVADPADLQAAYAEVAAASPDSHPERFPTEADALAYWINAYNIGAMVLVADHYPVDSVQAVRGPFWSFVLPAGSGFFFFHRLEFGGEELSLYALENDVVRARFADPRTHFALNCASLGCPELPNEPFTAADLEAQLEREARAFFADPEQWSYDPDRGVLLASSILDWYAEDFVAPKSSYGDATLLEFARRFAPLSTVPADSDTPIEFTDYDWGLNAR